ncbi:MAG: hypothetical protein JWP44_4855 [Mucilaginibacter sp.]|nr:hypothetical protein [Mucilaginibacter sp.]
MTDEQAYEELESIAEELDVADGSEAPSVARLRELASKVRECSVAL